MWLRPNLYQPCRTRHHQSNDQPPVENRGRLGYAVEPDHKANGKLDCGRQTARLTILGGFRNPPAGAAVRPTLPQARARTKIGGRWECIVGCEVKVSWFDAEANSWHATLTGEARRVKGQLKVLTRFGFERVGFFHLGATKPRSIESVNPWMLAGSDAALAWSSFPELPSLREIPECGYFQAVVGSVPFAAEDSSGAGGPMRVLQPGSTINQSPLPFRERLADRLAQLPQPRLCRVFVRGCTQCGDWSLVGSSGTAVCASCGGTLYDDSSGGPE